MWSDQAQEGPVEQLARVISCVQHLQKTCTHAVYKCICLKPVIYLIKASFNAVMIVCKEAEIKISRLMRIYSDESCVWMIFNPDL